MKTKILLLLLLLPAAGKLVAQNKLTIVVDGIEEVTGNLFAALYDKGNFLKKPVAGQITKVESDTVTIVFENIPSGDYAVSLFQDENGNGKLDTGMYGIPTEQYGFSNNAKGKYGPPDFEDCRFRVQGDTRIFIKI